MRLGLLLVVATTGAWAQLAELRALEAAQKAVLADPATRQDAALRGNSPALTEAKHRLREWVESRLGTDGEVTQIAERLNGELKSAGLLCEDSRGNCLGRMLPLELKVAGNGFVSLKTSFRIASCGTDDSAYLYRREGARWVRVLESEETAQEARRYRPQWISGVELGPTYGEAAGKPFFALVMGRMGWCASSWHPNYVRVYRVDPVRGGRIVLDVEYPWTFSYAPVGRVTEDRVLVEFREAAMEGGMTYAAIHSWEWDGARLVRTDPLAYRPKDFAMQWLRNEWSEVKDWTEVRGRPGAQLWHQRLHEEQLRGTDVGPTQRCVSQPDVWQVAYEMGEPSRRVYFRMRWTPPFQFRMVEVSEKNSRDCLVQHPEVDEERYTMFPR